MIHTPKHFIQASESECEIQTIYFVFLSVPQTCGGLAASSGKLLMDCFLNRLHWRTWKM